VPTCSRRRLSHLIGVFRSTWARVGPRRVMTISPVFYGSPSAHLLEAFITSGIILIAAAVVALFIRAGRSSHQLETVATGL